MSNSLDKSLDEVIRENKNKQRNSKYRHSRSGSFSNSGPLRRSPSHREPVRASPYSVAPSSLTVRKPVTTVREPVIETGGGFGGVRGSEGTKLYISNLDYGVTNKDIEVLFSAIGDLKSSSLHCDKSGRSKGTAEVVFHSQKDALTSIKRYDGVSLDGKPIKIEIVGVSSLVPHARPRCNNSGQDVIAGRGHGHGRIHHHNYRFTRDHGTGSSRYQQPRNHHPEDDRNAEKYTAQYLDADLEKYRMRAKKRIQN